MNPNEPRTNLLLVEDRADDADLVRIVLKRANLAADLEVVENENQIRTALASRVIDVVVTDMSLPQYDGFRVIRLAQEFDETIPVIALSGTYGEDFAVDAMRAGATDYVLKSQLNRLPHAIRGAVERRRLMFERKHAQEELKRSRAQLAAIVESAMDAIVTVDDQFRIVLFNEAASQLFRCPIAEAIGTHFERFVPHELRGSHREHVRVFLQSGQSKRRMGALGHVRALRSDGSEFIAEASLARVSLTGQYLYTVILRDISERIWADQERRRLQEQFLVAQKLEGLGAIAGGVGHDFANLLTAIRGNLEIAVQNADGQPRILDDLNRSLLGIDRASALTRQLVTYAGRPRAELGVVDVSTQVREMLDLLRSTKPAKVDMALELTSSPTVIDADSGQIQQLLLNLVVNACEACADKGGTVTIRTRTLRVGHDHPIHDLDPGDWIEISVSDDGIGMDAETRERIFDPFFTTKELGRGFGLSAVLGIVRAHRAHLEVESSPNLGSEFRIYFPSSTQAMAPTPRAPVETRGNERVLVVDDEPLVLDVISMLLRKRGYSVKSFDDPKTALDDLRSQPNGYDIAIVDFSMPEMSGVDLALAMRVIHPDLPIVLASGFDLADSQVPPDLRNVGILRKPFAAHQLVSTVKDTLAGRTLAVERGG